MDFTEPAGIRPDPAGPDLAPLLPGDLEEIGPYRLLGRLGSGGMGTVYLGRAPDDALVAVKVIRPELAGRTAFRTRFRREATAARRVARFCTASVLDADVDSERPYIVTEYIAGPDLEKVVEERGPLTGSALDALAVGVLTALTAIHGAGIVHRDLKPGNVLLSETGPRVIDFGISGALEFTMGLTATNQWLGSPAFMAPEQVDGRPVTPAADVFAWGALITYAATGRRPFDGATLARLVYQIAHEPPALDGIDPGLRPLVERALAKDPADRPAAAELLRTLLGAPAATGAQALARAELVEEADDTVRRSWPGTTAGTSPAPFPQAPPPPAPRPPASRPRRRRLGALAAVIVVALAGVGGLLYGPRVLDWLDDGRGGSPPAGTGAPGNQPPWAGAALPQVDAPAVALVEYNKSGLAPACPLLTFDDLGKAAGATPRRADFGEADWATAWDSPGMPGVEASGVSCPDCGRGALGIASMSDPGDPVVDDQDADASVSYDDGSTIAVFDGEPVTDDPDGIQQYSARIRMPGNECAYWMWTYIDREHLDHLISRLRVVEG
jgi:hypothetical protein